jgi:hypothetical protein
LPAAGLRAPTSRSLVVVLFYAFAFVWLTCRYLSCDSVTFSCEFDWANARFIFRDRDRDRDTSVRVSRVGLKLPALTSPLFISEHSSNLHKSSA